MKQFRTCLIHGDLKHENDDGNEILTSEISIDLQHEVILIP